VRGRGERTVQKGCHGGRELKIEQLVRKGILDLEAYIPGKSIEEVEKEYRVKRWIKLASNENLFGPSPKALEAIRREVRSIHFYPEGPCPVLRQALAQKLSIPESMIVITNGADHLIELIAAAFVNEGDDVVTAEPTFPVYGTTAQIMGGKVVKVPLRDFTHDLPAMLKKVNRKTKIVFICNPNNPTGTSVSRDVFDDFLSKLPDRVIVCLDEAYGDFVEDPLYPDGLEYLQGRKQVIVLRTFSKVYGLAGLRIGYGLGKKNLIDCLYRVRDPFPVNRLAQVAALAALKDEDHVLKSVQFVYEGRRTLYRQLDRLGISYVPSQANFILIDLEKEAQQASKEFLQEGVIVRPGKVWGYPTWIRVTIGTTADNRGFITALKKILKKGR
jgi:histidinol-phosphate aminotransferase